MPECSEPGCDAPHRARGLCNTHYHYRRRHGTLPPKQKPITGCRVEDCDRAHEARGLCGLHYQRLMSAGTVHLNRPTPEDRFWEKVDKRGADDCWEWQGSSAQTGHGTFWDGEQPTGAHRFSYELHVGDIPEGRVIDHLCDNGACVNPDHLQLASMRENNLRSDTIAARNAAKTHCKRGHPLSGDNLYVAPKTGARNCRTCMRAADQRYKQRRRQEQ